MRITSIESLIAFLTEKDLDVIRHVKHDDTVVPTFSKERLEHEMGNLRYAIDHHVNYTPAHYGYGLLSRCLSIAIENGGVIDFAFFRVAYNREDSVELMKVIWY